MVYYVNATRKAFGARYPSEIEGYQINLYKVSSGDYYPKAKFFSEQYRETDTYYSFNPRNGKSALLFVGKSINEELYLQSVSNYTEKDNLLELPNV